MSGAARRAASGLVAAEIALAVVLLIGAGLTLRSFAKLIAVDPGFTADGVITVQLGLPAGRYREQPARSAAYQRIFAALDALPQVDTVGAAAVTPLTGNNWTAPLVRPEHPLPAGERPPEVGWQSASAGYFGALRIPLRAGRLFEARDTEDSPPVVIVSDALAERYFPGEDPVGKRIRLGDGTAEIVGRVGDIRRASLSDAPRADLYFPFERQNGNGVTLFLRTVGDPLAAFPAIRAAVRQAEPDALLCAGAHAVGDRRRVGRGVAAGDAAARRLRRDRPGAGRRRHLRRDVLQRAAPDARARHAAGAGREPPRHRRPGDAAGRGHRRRRASPPGSASGCWRPARCRRCSTTCRRGIRCRSRPRAWCWP